MGIDNTKIFISSNRCLNGQVFFCLLNENCAVIWVMLLFYKGNLNS